MRKNMITQRKAHKLTQSELGEMCGVAQRTIAAYESGERRPTPEVAKRIGDVLGIPWTDFYEDEKQ